MFVEQFELLHKHTIYIVFNNRLFTLTLFFT